MKRDLILRLAGTAWAVLMLVSLSSCEKIYDDLEACPHGVALRFVYDYNMEYANAFPKQVDCMTLYVYDKENRYVATHVVTADSLPVSADLAPWSDVHDDVMAIPNMDISSA